MRRVITISLNGNAYALEEDAADAVAAYLESARIALASNSDLAEILLDLEQAIAEKSQRFLGPHKTVLTRSEIDAVLAEMGPVEPDTGANEPSPSAAHADAPAYTRRRRLYRIKEGEMVAGVCNGLAAYFGVDVSWVRIAVVALTLCGGFAGALYIGLIIILPVARTPEELAAAHGEPFNAREFVERARREAASLTGRDWQQEKATLKAEWHKAKTAASTGIRASLRRWRYSRVDARRRRRQAAGAAPNTAAPASAAAATPTANARPRTGLGGCLAALLMIPLVLIFGGLALAWVIGIVTLMTTGAMFGLLWPAAIPIWAVVLIMWIAFAIIAWPFRLLCLLLFPTVGGRAGWGSTFSLIESVVGFAVVCALIYWGYDHVPAITHLIDSIGGHVQSWMDRVAQHVHVDVET